jgi:aurora kinase
VYLAIHKKTGLICALKKVKKESVRFMLDQFIQEIKIQLFLNHAKLVKVYGYFSDAEYFYILIEYMEDGSLYSLMKKKKKIDEIEVAEKLN